MNKRKLCNLLKKYSKNSKLTYKEVSEIIDILCTIEAAERVRRGTQFLLNSYLFEILEDEVQKALKEIKRKK